MPGTLSGISARAASAAITPFEQKQIDRQVYVVRKAIKHDSFERQWHFVDAENLVPVKYDDWLDALHDCSNIFPHQGRLATRLCPLLMGKHRPDYSPHSDMGDYVVVRWPVPCPGCLLASTR